MTKATGFTKAPSKLFGKQKRGPDQEFTLPKGTSAAPIKQSKTWKLSKEEKGFLLGTTVTGAIHSGLEKTKKPKASSSTPSGGLRPKRPKGGWTPGV